MSAKPTILVVDDEPDIVRSLQDLFRLDYRVLGTTSPTEGLGILADEDVQVVISDQRMPEMPGVEFLKHCHESHPDAVRLLFTGYADIGAVIDAINEGHVYRYVSKPWNPRELETIIREAVDRWNLLAEKRKLVADLQAANRELAETNEALLAEKELRSAFIKVASHELRAPLTILLGTIQLAKRSPTPQAGAILGRIEDAGVRLRALVDNLVKVLAVGQYGALVDRSPIALEGLLHQAADDVRPFVEMRGQTLDVSVAPDAGSMELDGPKIRNMLDHLLVNAVKFTPDGGNIVLALERRADGAATIEVRDDGDGIEPAAADRLFESFFTEFDVSHHSSGRFEYRSRGLGLGLTVVKEIVELHGGTIDVRTERGSGTTFTVVLPARALS